MANNNKHTGPNVPALRFPEFSGEWENECLGNISENISSGKTKLTTKEGKYVLIGSTGIIGNASNADYSGNLILVARVGANAGLINYYSGECGISDNTLIVKPSQQENYFCRYVYHYLKHCNLNQYVFGSGQPLITGGMLKGLPIRYGTTDEINKLSYLFDLLDSRIETQSKIIEELTTLRSALAEKCSNQSGELVFL
ncbi:MAG: restriction endonuclease subunit S, partial [Candidatus Cryptobacteroides sp.]